MATRQNRSAFTLIELLVVIAIIALLAAILFPVFSRAREKGRQAACMSNMKQLGGALLMYAQDYEDTLPLATETGPSGLSTYWSSAMVLGPYLKDNNVYQCPDDIWNDTNWAKYPAGTTLNAMENTTRPPVNISYLPNMISPNVWHSSPAAPLTDTYLGMVGPQGPFASTSTSETKPAPVPQSIAKFAYPGDLILLLDVADGWSAYFDGTASINNNEEDAWEGDCIKDDISGAVCGMGMSDGEYAYIILTDAARHPKNTDGQGMTKHSGMTNVLFADGHVKAWAPLNFLSPTGNLVPKNWAVNAL